MSAPDHRLPADARHGFGGRGIDRNRPFAFRLDGRTIRAFAGDTVLSAALAAGIDTLGLRKGDAVALDERTIPAVAPRKSDDPATMLPMDRIPAAAGLDLVTVGTRLGPTAPIEAAGWLRDRLFGPRHSLNLKLDEAEDLERPWRRLPPTATLKTGLLVVGGGVAGMNAALAAVRAGEAVILAERRLFLGGDAAYFGAVGEEEPPDVSVARLGDALAASGAIVHLGAEVLSLSGTTARAHLVEAGDGFPRGRSIAIEARRVVLATGASERLPVFSGNRIAGVVGAVAAFHRAERYGLWRGRSALVAVASSYGYRLALQAADAGIAVPWIADSRAGAESRFIDFAKASGIRLAPGIAPRLARPDRRGDGIVVDMGPSSGSGGRDGITVDQLICSGGFQPELRLWLAAGGRSRWNAATAAIEAEGGLDAIVLAGSAAGYRGNAACRASGAAAVASLLGKSAAAIADPQIDPLYETPDAPVPVAPWRAQDRAHVFLDGGLSFTLRPAPGPRDAVTLAAAPGQTPSLGDLAAAVQLGAIPADEAGAVAEERCTIGDDLADAGWRPYTTAETASPVPAYLEGRFGPKPRRLLLVAADGRRFEAGCLVFTDSVAKKPLAAVGAVLGAGESTRGGGAALVAALDGDTPLFVRDSSGSVRVSAEAL